MADQWHAVYRVSDGQLLSIATVVDRLRPGVASTPIDGPPGREVWNTSTLQFDPLPPPLPDIDRVDEIITAMTRSGGRFSEDEVRREVALLLGSFRFRDPSFEGRNLL